MAGLFPRPQSSGAFGNLDAIRGMVGGNPAAFAQRLMSTNPTFAQFVRQNQGKTPEQIASENGIDYGALRRYMGQ